MIDLLFILFKGKDCICKFIAWVLDEERWNKQIKKYFDKRSTMMSEDEQKYNDSKLC